MRRWRLSIIAFLLCILSWHPDAWPLSVPALRGRINDYANLLDEHQSAQLEYALQRYEAQTTNQIVLLTIPSLEGEDLEGFSVRVAETWKIGQKGKDNGVILLVTLKERKVRIEVGYGLEGVLTDAEASQIIRHVIAPAFRTGDYFGGISSGLTAIVKATKGEFQAPKEPTSPYSSHGLLLLFLLIIILFSRFGRFMFLGGMLGRGMFGGRMGRGGFGGGFGGFSGGGGGFGGGGASGSW
jgi:uncharacterized protein